MKKEIPKLGWSQKDAINVFAGFIALNILLFGIGLVHETTSIFNLFISSNDTINAIAIYIITAATFLYPLYHFLIKKHPNLTLKDFRLIPLKLKTIIKMVLMGYGLLFLLTLLLIPILSIFPDIPGLGPQENVLPVFGEGSAAMTTAAIIAIIIAPIIEEIFFRGYLLQSLMNRCSFLTASIITAAIFAFVHFQFESIIGIFFLSLIINYIYYRSGNTITATIAFHMVNNAVAFTIILNYSHLIQ